jgi:methylmalonyl-CoA/ethylmalonyl-CoA epimerase
MLRIDHIAVAVSDLDAAEKAYRDTLALDWVGREEVAGQKVLAGIFRVGESRVELLAPTAPDSPIAGFLEKRGPGLHHICFEVEDIEAEIVRLKSRGARLLNETPSPGVEGSRIAFLHPKEAAGVLIELVERRRE